MSKVNRKYKGKNNKDKFDIVINKNTFYFYNPDFQEKYESYINSLTETLLVLKNNIDVKGLQKDIFETLIKEREFGLKVLLALTGFSNESLKRVITIIRVSDNKELSKITFKNKWEENNKLEKLVEWGDNKILSFIKNNQYFRKGIINLFFEGSTIPFLSSILPLFELKKLSISKLKFELPALIDTLVRYKEKSSYSGKQENNPEYFIASILKKLNIPFEKGDLTELIKYEPIAKRTMDFIIPNKVKPKIIIESSFLTTTSSGQGDKSKTENSIRTLISKYYPNTLFYGFVDGVGWYVRKGDLLRMVSAYDDVFTFHKDEMARFKKIMKGVL
jgi:hypothetical protein